MIISHSRQFVFVHLHKTAGSSVADALNACLSDGDHAIGSRSMSDAATPGMASTKKGLQKHSSARRIRNVLGPKTWNSYFTFSVVRHPFDRMVSLYEFLRRVRRNNLPELSFKQRILSESRLNQSLLDLAEDPWTWASMKALLTTHSFAEFIRSDYLHASHAAQPQYQRISNRAGKLLVDYVAKLETIADDWPVICERISIEPDLPHMNRSRREHKESFQYWNDDARNFAIEHFQQDFEHFGYSPDACLTP